MTERSSIIGINNKKSKKKVIKKPLKRPLKSNGRVRHFKMKTPMKSS